MMNTTRKTFIKCLSAICAVATFQLLSTTVSDAAVVQRPKATASRASTAKRKTPVPKPAATEPTTVEKVETPELTPPAPIDISKITQTASDTLSRHIDDSDDSKLSLAFERYLAKTSTAEEQQIQEQQTNNTNKLGSSTEHCNETLRKCMEEKCGNGFTDCANETTAQLDAKLNACRGKTKCSATEYNSLSAEILADIDTNRTIGTFNKIINCGTGYNNCLVAECGADFRKCIALAAGNAATNKCKAIAKECEQYDNGLEKRALSVFSRLRVNDEEQIASDEKRLYALRDEMSAHCTRMGASFDERTFKCIYSIEFIAGSDSTLFASKKALAGSTFICEPDWFGIDITTFRENVYRHIRSQTSATAAMLGTGIGIAAGTTASGALNRAIETAKAQKALKQAEKEHDTYYSQEVKDMMAEAMKQINQTDNDAKKSSNTSVNQSASQQNSDPTGNNTDKPANNNSPQTDSSADTKSPKTDTKTAWNSFGNDNGNTVPDVKINDSVKQSLKDEIKNRAA